MKMDNKTIKEEIKKREEILKDLPKRLTLEDQMIGGGYGDEMEIINRWT